MQVTRVHHPIFTSTEVARMPSSVRAMFTDNAEAHAAARRDFERDSIASRMAQASFRIAA